MKKYKIKPYDVVGDIWLLNKRIFLIFWWCIGVGTKKEVLEAIKELELES